MILDFLQQLYSGAVVTVTGISTNVIDLEEVGNHVVRALGNGEPVGCFIAVTSAPSSANSNETYVATLETDSVVGLGSSTVLATQTITRGSAATPVGTKFFLPIPPNVTLKRYIGLRMTLGGTSPTITITAYLTANQQFENNVPYYPIGFTVN